MSTTDAADTGSWAQRVPRAAKREQTPWLKPEDAAGWTRIGRGKGHGKLPLISVQVDLNEELSAWLRAEAKRTGLDYGAVVERLVEEARAKTVVTPT